MLLHTAQTTQIFLALVYTKMSALLLSQFYNAAKTATPKERISPADRALGIKQFYQHD